MLTITLALGQMVDVAEVKNSGDENAPLTFENKALHRCSQCRFMTNQRYNLSRHIKQCHEKIICNSCNINLIGHKALVEHAREVHAKDVEPTELAWACSYCPLKFSTVDQIAHHVKKTHDLKQCDEKPKKSVDFDNLFNSAFRRVMRVGEKKCCTFLVNDELSYWEKWQ